MKSTGYYRTCGPAGEVEWIEVVATGNWRTVSACPHCGNWRMGHLVVESGGQLNVAGGLTTGTLVVHSGGTVTMAAEPSMSGGSGGGILGAPHLPAPRYRLY